MKPIYRPFPQLAQQRGQALIYGIFIIIAALAGTFFLFNTGQLSAEKTKLVNTADAVAYSAGVMHARALNFNAYTNRALLANETTIAQMVSVASWLRYSRQHNARVGPMLCSTNTPVPVVLATIRYVPLCGILANEILTPGLNLAQATFNVAGPLAFQAAEASKFALQGAQAMVFADMLIARNQVLREVANANYLNDGSVSVDAMPTDNWIRFEGGPFIARRSGNERARFRSLELLIINRDAFVSNRSWSSKSPWPCVAPTGHANRFGGTVLDKYDSWRADDYADFTIRKFKFSLRDPCKVASRYVLGTGTQSATSTTPGYRYSGVPNFWDLSDAAQDYRPENTTVSRQRDPKLQFATRLTRAKAQQKTSEGSSEIRPAGRLAVYTSEQAGGVMAAVATSEVFFDRSHTPRIDGRVELASLFNPFWQVHLVPNSEIDTAAAIALQGVGP